MTSLILDGNSIVNRAFFGVRMLNSPDGTPTNAIFGFFNILHKLYTDFNPDGICVCFDVHSPTFRHKAYDKYKAKRTGMPEELKVQMPILKDILKLMGIECFELEGFEADDLIGTISDKYRENGDRCIIVTGDRDSLQLVNDNTSVCLVKSGVSKAEYITYTPESFLAEYGFEPVRIVDLKALMGDASDNIPGVPGIGEKTAKGLISTFGSMNEIYNNLESLDIKDSVKNRLIDGKESADLSYWLATIVKEAPLDFNPDSTVYNGDYDDGLYSVLKKLGLNKIISAFNVQDHSFADNSDVLKRETSLKTVCLSDDTTGEFLSKLKGSDFIALECSDYQNKVSICDGAAVYVAERTACLLTYDTFIESVFSDSIKKVSHNVKNILVNALSDGISAKGFIFDVSLAGYMINSNFGEYLPEKLAVRYGISGSDVSELTYLIYPVLCRMLDEYELAELFYNVEMPLCSVLAEMEHAGFLVDRNALATFGESLNNDIEVLKEKIYDYAGYSFNINSTKQLGEVLYDKLLLPHSKKTKSGYSTNAEALEKLKGKHPVIDCILEYRLLSKLKTTYADGLLKVLSEDNRIHSNFQMTATATGRLSSTEPNLQNIPVRNSLGASIRRMFIAPKGCVLVDADYSQIELRILAEFSGDEQMIAAFNSGEDFHAVTASKVFDVPLADVDSSLRSRAKAVNFGVIYGISAFGLAKDINVSTAEAREYIDEYMNKYSGVASYMKETVERAKTVGYVRTMYNRRREIPELKDKNAVVRSFGERIALNTPIQGTAADIIKIAMINVDKRIKSEDLKARLILQVHDELIVECPEEEKTVVMSLLKEEMENVIKMSVPLTVEAKYGENWAAAH